MKRRKNKKKNNDDLEEMREKFIKSNKKIKIKLNIEFAINENTKIEYKILNDSNEWSCFKTEYEESIVEKPIKIKTTPNDLMKYLSKTGNTIFEFDEINIKMKVMHEAEKK